MRVLLAEDDDGVAGALTEALYEHGHLPTRVRRGEDVPPGRAPPPPPPPGTARPTCCCSTSACPTSTAWRCCASCAR